MKKNFENLLEQVVTPGYCVGCGVCVSMCNFETIDMRFNALGQYEPFYKESSTCTSCGLCVKVCPFENGNDNEDAIGKRKFAEVEDIQQREEVGYFLDSYVGYADTKTRLNGASGGGLTQLLKWLLETDKIDKVITVESTNNTEKLFQYTIVDTLEGVARCAKSAYYPVETSQVLEEARKSNGVRYAFVGLPCALKAVENAKKCFPKLKKSILFTFGIVCGQTKSKKYAEYLIRSLAMAQERVHSISFREKVKGYPASDYAFKAIDRDGNSRIRMWSNGVSDVWLNDLYKQKSCCHCDDVFAECADAVFMDAWLLEYIQEYEGTNLVINRSPQLTPFFTSKNYSAISIEKVIQSQQGVLNNKRMFRNLYDNFARKQSSVVPVKRTFTTIEKPTANMLRLQTKKYTWANTSLRSSSKDVDAIIRKIWMKDRWQIVTQLLMRVFKKVMRILGLRK